MPASNSRDPILVISETYVERFCYEKKEIINNQKKKSGKEKKLNRLDAKMSQEIWKVFSRPSDRINIQFRFMYTSPSSNRMNE